MRQGVPGSTTQGSFLWALPRASSSRFQAVSWHEKLSHTLMCCSVYFYHANLGQSVQCYPCWSCTEVCKVCYFWGASTFSKTGFAVSDCRLPPYFTWSCSTSKNWASNGAQVTSTEIDQYRDRIEKQEMGKVLSYTLIPSDASIETTIDCPPPNSFSMGLLVLITMDQGSMAKRSCSLSQER